MSEEFLNALREYIDRRVELAVATDSVDGDGYNHDNTHEKNAAEAAWADVLAAARQ